jgi:hypothetical protein
VLWLLVTAKVVPSSLILSTLIVVILPPKRRFLQDPQGVTCQKTLFFIVTAVKTSNLTQIIDVYPTIVAGREGTTVVAVKTLKENASDKERSDLVQELQVMKMLEPHPNVVRLLGCCTEKGKRTASTQICQYF